MSTILSMSFLSANNIASPIFRTYRGLCSAHGEIADAPAAMREVGGGENVGAPRIRVVQPRGAALLEEQPRLLRGRQEEILPRNFPTVSPALQIGQTGFARTMLCAIAEARPTLRRQAWGDARPRVTLGSHKMGLTKTAFGSANRLGLPGWASALYRLAETKFSTAFRYLSSNFVPDAGPIRSSFNQQPMIERYGRCSVEKCGKQE